MADPRPVGFWLKLVDQLIDKQFSDALEEHGVTRRQWQLLGVLARGSATMLELASALGPFIDTAAGETVMDHIGELVESEWVVDSDGTFSFTERGTTAHARLTEIVDGIRSLSVEGVGAAEYSATLDVLERMARNLGWTDSER